MGDQKYEHTQNITLQRILQGVMNLQSIHQDMDAVDAQQVCCAGDKASFCMAASCVLQTHVCVFEQKNLLTQKNSLTLSSC
jgi:hypothetical protein